MTVFHLREMLITDKGLLIFALLAVFCVSDAVNYRVTRSAADTSLLNLKSQYYGRIDDSLMKRIQNDRKEIHNAWDEFEAQYKEWSRNGIENLTDEQRDELQRLNDKGQSHDLIDLVYTEVQELYEAGAEYYQNQEGLDLLTGRNNPVLPVRLFLMWAVPLILVTAGMISSPYQNGLSVLYRSTAMGRKKSERNKVLLLCGYGIACALMVYACHAVKILTHYSVSFSGSARQLGIPFSLPLSVCFAIHSAVMALILVSIVRLSGSASRQMPALGAAAVCVFATILLCLLPFTGFLVRIDSLQKPLFSAVPVSLMILLNIAVSLHQRKTL